MGLPFLLLLAAAGAGLPPSTPAPAELRYTSSADLIERAARAAQAAAAKGDPLALAHVYRLWNLHAMVESPDRVARAFDAIRKAPKADPLARAHAAYLYSGLLIDKGKLEEGAALRKELGLASDVWLIGPFENSAGRGHGEVFPPETEVALDASVPGKGHLVRWRRTQGLAPWGVIPLSNLVSPSTDGTAYVLAAVRASSPVRAALHLGGTDRVKVFFDGKEIFAEDTIKRAELDQTSLPIEIAAGLHALLVKVSWSGSAASVKVRFTTPEGKPLDGVSFSAERADVEQALSAIPQSQASHDVAGVRDAIDRAVARATPANRASLLALRSDLYAILNLFDRRKLPTPPEQDLDEAIRARPSDPDLRFFYAHRVAAHDRAIAREQLDAALAADPGHVPSMIELADLEAEAGRTVEARKLVEAAIRKDPTFDRAHIALAGLRGRGMYEEHNARADLAKAPNLASSPRLLVELAERRKRAGDLPGALDAAASALTLDRGRSGARAILIDAAIDRGDVERSVQLLDESIALHPSSAGLLLRKARVLSGEGKAEGLARALAVLDRAAAAFPDVPEVFDLLAELRLRTGDSRGALAALEQSLEIDPHRPDVRRHRAALSGTKTELEDELSIDATQLASIPVSPEEKNWGGIYLTERMAVRLFDSGQATRFQQYVVRVHNPELSDALRTQRIRFSPSREVVEILSAERIRPSGEVIKATRITEGGPTGKVSGMYVDGRWKTIQLDDLEQGDLIHIRYRTDSIGQNIFGSFFGDVTPLQTRLPKRDVLYVAFAPASRPLHAASARVPDPKVTIQNGVQRTEWSLGSVPALDLEPHPPPYNDQGMYVSVSTYKTWNDLGHWYAGLFSEQLELDETARQAGRRAIEGASSPREKITKLYDYVVKNTRYVGIELGIHGWKPFKASEVHRRRYGDCKDKATLLASLLKDNGIDATIALVRTADRGPMPADHATMWAFNHAITYVPSEDLYLDGTAEYSGSRELPYLDQGAMVLVVYPDGRTVLGAPDKTAPDDNLNVSTYAVAISPDGGGTLRGRETFHGARAAALREEYDEPKQRKAILEKQLGSMLPGVQVMEVTFSDLSDLEAPPSYEYAAAVRRWGADGGGGQLVLPLALFPHRVSDAFATLPERKQELWLAYPWKTKNQVRYRLAGGLKIAQLPESAAIDSKHVALSQTIKAIDGGYEVEDVLTLKSSRIPAADYAEFRAACLAIDRALGRKVVLAR